MGSANFARFQSALGGEATAADVEIRKLSPKLDALMNEQLGKLTSIDFFNTCQRNSFL